MMNYQPGDLVLVAFPYTAGNQTRTRPALVVLDSGDADVLVARVTTQLYRTPYDVVIRDWRGAGLLAASVVRLHKLATLDKGAA
ncbi:MAG TPA: type II toxin-antitoxin system PemK/MazF family toxin [Chloroflexota bacterium]|jgi:mRNA interferase MazF